MTCEVVDVGGAVVGPFGDVVGLAEVSGDVAVGVGVAAVAGDQILDRLSADSINRRLHHPNRTHVRTPTTVTDSHRRHSDARASKQIDRFGRHLLRQLNAGEVCFAPETTVAKPWMAGGEIVVKCVVLPDLGM